MRVLIILLLFVFGETYAQDFQRYNRLNYTTEDGLPSNECHEILQDSLGYLWIATDRGLVRYDGYEFKTYGIPEGLENISCLNIELDEDQNIWILTLDGKVFKLNIPSDRIYKYESQAILDSLSRIIKVVDFELLDDSVISFSLEGIGILDINASGETNFKIGKVFKGYNNYYSESDRSNVIIVNNNRAGSPTYEIRADIGFNDYRNHSYELFKIQHKGHTIDGVINEYAEKSSRAKIFKLNEDYSLVNIYGIDYYIDSDTVFIKMNKNVIEHLSIINDSSYVVSEVNRKGVSFFENIEALKENYKTTLIRDVSATHSMLDKEDNLWVTTLEQGLFKLEKSIIQTQSFGLGERVTSLEQGHEGLYYVIERRILNQWKPSLGTRSVLKDDLNSIGSLAYDKYSNSIIVPKGSTVVVDDKFEAEELSYSYYNKLSYSYYNKVVPISSNNAFVLSEIDYLFANSTGFLVYNNLADIPNYNSNDADDVMRVLGAERLDDMHYLIATTKGLIQFKNCQVQKIDNRPSLLASRINDIKVRGDNYLFATQGNGLVCWNLDENVLHITKEDGILSNNIEQIFVDSNQDVFLGTKAGLSQLKFEGNDSLVVRNYTTFHGLPSSEVNDITELNGNVYVATSKGIANIPEALERSAPHAVIIEDFLIDGLRSFVEIENVSLSFHNNLSIQYKTIDHSMHSKIDYGYRLNSGPWTITRSTKVSFSALSPDKYMFEVQSKNRDDVWSDSSIVNFVVNPPWWRTWWFYCLGFGLLGFLSYYIYKRRTGYLEEKNAIDAEIRDLERAALQSQMNPHFIFNCLNSIQRFIMDNNKEQAMEYLSKFAQLIRQTLNASSQKKISLSSEISMLKNYLELEKLRFKNKFDYYFKINDNVIVDEIYLPPLLIQPYVENAVLHGMKFKESGGRIDISFEKSEPEFLSIIVKDNGAGSVQTINAAHKSLGVSITSRRINHNNKLTDRTMEIIPEYSDSGTTVRILVRL